MESNFKKFGKDSLEYKKSLEIYKTKRKEYNILDKMQKRTPTLTKSKTLIRFTYTRYADDWIISTNANYELTNIFKEIFTKWLKENLLLELSEQKTSITGLKEKGNKARFLGFSLSYYSKKSVTIAPYGRYFKIKLDTVRLDKIRKLSKNKTDLIKKREFHTLI